MLGIQFFIGDFLYSQISGRRIPSVSRRPVSTIRDVETNTNFRLARQSVQNARQNHRKTAFLGEGADFFHQLYNTPPRTQAAPSNITKSSSGSSFVPPT